jgi:hypothetical protein
MGEGKVALLGGGNGLWLPLITRALPAWLFACAVVRRRGLVNDPTDDVNRVTSSIKDDIALLNRKLEDLEVCVCVRVCVCARVWLRGVLYCVFCAFVV